VPFDNLIIDDSCNKGFLNAERFGRLCWKCMLKGKYKEATHVLKIVGASKVYINGSRQIPVLIKVRLEGEVFKDVFCDNSMALCKRHAIFEFIKVQECGKIATHT